jgi:DNA end-binding protein Ku
MQIDRRRFSDGPFYCLYARSRQAYRHQTAGNFEPEKFEDHYETALIDLINQKRSGKIIRPKERPKGENVVDLMDALRRGVGGTRSTDAAPTPRKPAEKLKKASAGQKDMRMPIAYSSVRFVSSGTSAELVLSRCRIARAAGTNAFS